MAVISRKYRPQTFADMVGQNHIKLTLQNELANNNFAQAYIFCGPRGLGKTTAARLFAKAVNCQKRSEGQSEPCNKCESCLAINQGKAIDIVEIDAASHTGVDNVRENIIENVRFAPSQSKYKVFIIDEVHMLSISAFNALLKTLEEPPAHTIFILCTTEIHKVPDTIISRCQRFDFKKVSATEMIKRLQNISRQEKVKVDEEVLEIIASKSEGCMRDAESLLSQVLSLGAKHIKLEEVKIILPKTEIQIILKLLKYIVQDQPKLAIEYVNDLVEEGLDLEVLAKEIVEFLRKLILIKAQVRKIEWFSLASKQLKETEEILSYSSLEKLVKMIKIFMKVVADLKKATLLQLPFELAILELCPLENSNFKNQNNAFISKLSKEEKDINSQAEKVKEKESLGSQKEISNGKINFAKIKKNWLKIIQNSHKLNRDLMFINEKVVWPLETKLGKLILGFRYELHKSRFETNGNMESFSQAIKEAVGDEVSIEAKTLKPSEYVELEREAKELELTQDKMSGVKVTEDNILDQILENFGGEVVEESN